MARRSEPAADATTCAAKLDRRVRRFWCSLSRRLSGYSDVWCTSSGTVANCLRPAAFRKMSSIQSPAEVSGWPDFRAARAWLLVIGSGWIVAHLILLSRFHLGERLAVSLIVWAAIVELVGRKRNGLQLESGPTATLLGWVLFTAGLGSFLLMVPERPLRLQSTAVMGALGVSLMASGWTGPRLFWRELVILLCLPLFIILFELPRVFDLSPAVAQTSGFMLWYLGFDVSVVGTEVQLPTGSVNVGKTCVGLSSLGLLMTLAVIVLMLFPTKRLQRLLIPATAMCLAFICNCIRVACLALVQARISDRAFEFWHQGPGSSLWSVIPVALFCGALLVGLRHARPSSAGERSARGADERAL